MPARMSSEDVDRLRDRIDGDRPEVVLFNQLGPPLPKTYLVDGVIPHGEFIAVYGEPGSGKGNFALDIAAHVAAGRPWRGKKVEKAGVLYLALERREQVARRMHAFVQHHQVPTSQFTEFNLAVSSEPIDLRVKDSLLNRWIHARWELFEDAVGEDVPELGLIVIDTFSRALGDGSDSDDRDQNAVAAHIEEFTRLTGCTVLVIHHTPVGDSSRLRGHSALLAALDQTIRLKKSRGKFSAKVIKENDRPDDPSQFDFETLPVVLHTADDGTETTAPVVVPLGVSLTEAASEPADAEEKPVKLAPSHAAVLSCLIEPATLEEWREASYTAAGPMGASGKRKRFTRALDALTAAGAIETDGLLFWPKRDTGQSGTEDNFSSCPAPLSALGDSGTGQPLPP